MRVFVGEPNNEAGLTLPSRPIASDGSPAMLQARTHSPDLIDSRIAPGPLNPLHLGADRVLATEEANSS